MEEASHGRKVNKFYRNKRNRRTPYDHSNKNIKKSDAGDGDGDCDHVKTISPSDSEHVVASTDATAIVTATTKPSSSTTTNALSKTRFADCRILSSPSQRAIKEMFKYEFMTRVQELTVETIALRGENVLARAKTGTGKTLGFLLPAIETLVTRDKQQRRSPRGIVRILVMSPTRELASQIAVEATMLLKFHPYSVGAIYGGTKMKKDVEMFKTRCPDILVATPGRLLDHLDNTPHFALQMNDTLSVLIFDEADQLLNMGFRPAIESILSSFKHTADSRQTLMFSATVSDEVHQICRLAFNKKEHTFIDAVPKDDVNTNAAVRQETIICVQKTMMSSLVGIIEEQRKVSNFKIIVFFVTANMTAFYAALFNSMDVPTLEIHSRKSQSAREKTSERFRDHSNLLLFSSDVSARGMDYPGVTCVIQVGMPSDRAQYIHRIGRTARAGNEGHAILLLHDFEMFFLNNLKDLPISRVDAPTLDSSLQGKLHSMLQSFSRDAKHISQGRKAYQAWLGYYNTNLRYLRWDKTRLVSEANTFALVHGLYEVPTITAKVAGKMGIRGTPGVRIERHR